MAFTDDLRETFDPLVEEIVEHPMVARLGEGTLDEDPFPQWVRQDYVSLIRSPNKHS